MRALVTGATGFIGPVPGRPAPLRAEATFVLFTHREQELHFPFERCLVNQLRRAFDFEGRPVVIRARARRR